MLSGGVCLRSGENSRLRGRLDTAYWCASRPCKASAGALAAPQRAMEIRYVDRQWPLTIWIIAFRVAGRAPAYPAGWGVKGMRNTNFPVRKVDARPAGSPVSTSACCVLVSIDDSLESRRVLISRLTNSVGLVVRFVCASRDLVLKPKPLLGLLWIHPDILGTGGRLSSFAPGDRFVGAPTWLRMVMELVGPQWNPNAAKIWGIFQVPKALGLTRKARWRRRRETPPRPPKLIKTDIYDRVSFRFCSTVCSWQCEGSEAFSDDASFPMLRASFVDNPPLLERLGPPNRGGSSTQPSLEASPQIGWQTPGKKPLKKNSVKELHRERCAFDPHAARSDGGRGFFQYCHSAKFKRLTDAVEALMIGVSSPHPIGRKQRSWEA